MSAPAYQAGLLGMFTCPPLCQVDRIIRVRYAAKQVTPPAGYIMAIARVNNVRRCQEAGPEARQKSHERECKSKALTTRWARNSSGSVLQTELCCAKSRKNGTSTWSRKVIHSGRSSQCWV